MIDKKSLSERDICTKFITPAIVKAGWDSITQFLEEVSFTDGKIYVRGKLHSRGEAKRADYILYYKPNIPIAIVEAKDNRKVKRTCPMKRTSRRGLRRNFRCDLTTSAHLQLRAIRSIGLRLQIWPMKSRADDATTTPQHRCPGLSLKTFPSLLS